MKIYNEKTSQFEEVKSVKYYSEEEGSIIKSVEEYQIPALWGETEFKEEYWLGGDYLPNTWSYTSSSQGVASACLKLNSSLLKNSDNLIIDIEIIDDAYVIVYIDNEYKYHFSSSGELILNYEEYKNTSIGFLITCDALIECGANINFSIQTQGGFIPIKSIKQYQDANNLITLEDFNQ